MFYSYFFLDEQRPGSLCFTITRTIFVLQNIGEISFYNPLVGILKYLFSYFFLACVIKYIVYNHYYLGNYSYIDLNIIYTDIYAYYYITIRCAPNY